MPVCKNIQNNISKYGESTAVSKDKEASFSVYLVPIQQATVESLAYNVSQKPFTS